MEIVLEAIVKLFWWIVLWPIVLLAVTPLILANGVRQKVCGHSFWAVVRSGYDSVNAFWLKWGAL